MRVARHVISGRCDHYLVRSLFVVALAVASGCTGSGGDAHLSTRSAASSGGATSTGGGTSTGGTTSTGEDGGVDPTETDGDETGTGGSEPSTGGTSASAGGSLEVPADLSAELYDPEHLPRFDIELPAASIEALNVASDEYAPGTLRYGNETVSSIGVRIKGEGSLRSLDQKAAFKLKFDKFVEDQSFRGLRRMTLNNMVEDPSFIAERLAYYVYRSAALPAPRCNSALVYVNDEFYGVYANVETEDKTFLRRWFANDEGNLYEEGQVDFVPGAEDMFDLETNEADNDRSDLANLIDVFQSAAPESYLADLGQALDTTHFLRFTAAEAAVNQWDMYSYTVFYPNNFRIYRDPSTQHFVFLPWGMDMSMKPFRDTQTPHLSVFGLTRRGDSELGPVTAGLMFQRCLESPSCKASYATAVSEIIALYESLDLETLAELYFSQIEEHIEVDPRKEYTMTEVAQHYQSVLRTIRERPHAMRADLE